MAVGRSLAELRAASSDEALSSCDVLLLCGVVRALPRPARRREAA